MIDPKLSGSGEIKIRVRSARFFVAGGILAFCAIFCLTFAAIILSVSSGFGTAFWTAFTGLAFFGLPGFFLLGIAIKQPIALRVDKNGISGYYADPATWHEIDEINAVTDSKGKTSVGFSLMDPVGFRDKQTPWRRFTYWSNGRGHGHHVIIPHLIFEPGQAEKLVHEARRLKSATQL